MCVLSETMLADYLFISSAKTFMDACSKWHTQVGLIFCEIPVAFHL